MAQQHTPAAGSGPHDKKEIEALEHRARIGLLSAAHIGCPERFAFWKGQASALGMLARGVGVKAAAIDEALSGYEAPGCYQAAWAALPERAERLSLAEVQQILVAHRVEISTDAVADGEIDPIEQFEDRVVSAVHPDDEHAAAGVDCNDGSSHQNSPGVVDAATVAQAPEQLMREFMDHEFSRQDRPGSSRSEEIGGAA